MASDKLFGKVPSDGVTVVKFQEFQMDNGIAKKTENDIAYIIDTHFYEIFQEKLFNFIHKELHPYILEQIVVEEKVPAQDELH